MAEDKEGPLSRQGERFVKMSLIYWWHIVLKFKAIESMGNLLEATTVRWQLQQITLEDIMVQEKKFIREWQSSRPLWKL